MENKNIELMKLILDNYTKDLWGNIGQRAQSLSYTGQINSGDLI